MPVVGGGLIGGDGLIGGGGGVSLALAAAGGSPFAADGRAMGGDYSGYSGDAREGSGSSGGSAPGGSVGGGGGAGGGGGGGGGGGIVSGSATLPGTGLASTPASGAAPGSVMPTTYAPLPPRAGTSPVSGAPEPAAWVFLVIGFGLVGAIARGGRRRGATGVVGAD